MQVFRLCLMILKKKLPILMIYVFVFLNVLLIVALNFNRSPEQAAFSTKRFPIALVAAREGPLVEGLREELAKTADFVTLPEDREKQQDALFFRSVTAIVRIPADFEDLILSGGKPVVEKVSAPNTVAGMNLSLLIDQYIRTARLHAVARPDLTAGEIAERTLSDLKANTPVSLQATPSTSANLSYTAYFFNYLSYVYLSVFILGISALMVVFNDPDLQRRNACSPIPAGRVNLQFLLANLLFTLIVWVVMGAMYFALSPDKTFTGNLGWFYANSLLYAFCAASLSYLIGISVKSGSAVSAVSNVVALGTSFLCGVFMPQSMLSAPVLRIAQFTPTFWYVRANNLLAESALTQASQRSEFSRMLLVQTVFGIAFLVLALVAGKRKNLRTA